MGAGTATELATVWSASVALTTGESPEPRTGVVLPVMADEDPCWGATQ